MARAHVSVPFCILDLFQQFIKFNNDVKPSFEIINIIPTEEEKAFVVIDVPGIQLTIKEVEVMLEHVVVGIMFAYCHYEGSSQTSGKNRFDCISDFLK